MMQRKIWAAADFQNFLARPNSWSTRIWSSEKILKIGRGPNFSLHHVQGSPADRDRVEWVRRQLDPPATFSLPDSVSKRAVVDKRSSLREESVKYYMHDLSEEFAHPKINGLHLPEHFSQLEARNTDDDNAKQRK